MGRYARLIVGVSPQDLYPIRLIYGKPSDAVVGADPDRMVFIFGDGGNNVVTSFGINFPIDGACIGSGDVSDVSLQVTLLGNPVSGPEVTVEVRGAGGQSLRLHLTDTNGKTVSNHFIEQTLPVEQHRLDIGQQATGLLLLRVSTPTQTRTVKVLKAN